MGIKCETISAGEDGKVVSFSCTDCSSCWKFFSLAFSNLLFGIPLLGVCHRVVYMYACAVEKKTAERKMCLST